MKKILIAYADEALAYSLKKLGKQAEHLCLFDEIILYTPAVLPEYIKSSPLMKYKRGGGYWCWKPAIIWETLSRHEDGDIVVYVDAGCTLKKMPEWIVYFELLKRYDTVAFQYRDEMPVWEKWGQTSTKIKYWTKKKTLLYFDDFLGTTEYQEFNKIFAGFLVCKGKNNQFVKTWLDTTLERPELIIDPTKDELENQEEGFAFHKHDQSIITPLAYYYKNVIVLPELCETGGEQVAVQATRIRCRNRMSYWGDRCKFRLRLYLGDQLFNAIKKVLLIK